jgi:hypothetical protein
VHPKVASEALGHSSVAFTMDTYQHLMPTMQEPAVRAIEEAIGGTVAAGLEDVLLPGRETAGGRRRIRTSVGLAGDFTDRSLWPLGHPPV